MNHVRVYLNTGLTVLSTMLNKRLWRLLRFETRLNAQSADVVQDRTATTTFTGTGSEDQAAFTSAVAALS
ncbi:hypothetical protein GCM10009791_20260 [Citricoccus zhacaiensis]